MRGEIVVPEWSENSVGSPSERDALVLEHIPLLKHIVGRMCFDVPGGMDRDDLYAIGMIGLISAADSWESERGLKFSTYAYTKIRGAILDELRKEDFLPRGRREKVRELGSVVERLEHEHGSAPSPEDMATAMGVSLGEIDEILLSASSASQVSIDEGPSDALRNLLSDPTCDDPVESAEWNEMKALLVEAIEELPEQEKTVITLYYAEGLLLKEIGQVLSVTESRVSQIHSRALYRLNRTFAALTGSTEN